MPDTKLIAVKRLHVFIADDDIDDIGFFRSAMQDISKNIRITVAGNGDELMEFLQIVIPDIIFLDINMPCKNGIDCLAEIRALKKFNHTPIIMYSTTSNPVHIEKTYNLGASMYLEKPASFDTIKKRLTQILSYSSHELLPQPSMDKYLIRDLY